jgi:hypothetical protein
MMDGGRAASSSVIYAYTKQGLYMNNHQMLDFNNLDELLYCVNYASSMLTSIVIADKISTKVIKTTEDILGNKDWDIGKDCSLLSLYLNIAANSLTSFIPKLLPPSFRSRQITVFTYISPSSNILERLITICL